MSDTLSHRIAAAARAAADADLDALLITNPANILYISGFGGTAGRVLLHRGRLYFMADFRYSRTVQALAGGWPVGSQVIDVEGGYDDTLAAVIERLGCRRLGIESGHVTLGQYRTWTAKLAGIDLVPTDRIVERLRLVKDAGELQTMRDAGRRISGIAGSLGEWVRPGRRERDIAADVNYAMARAGFSRPAFETIVASGPHAALPHARPGDRTLTAGDLVVVDFGGMLGGYAVDITRTLSIGAPGEQAARMHAAVLEAQAAAAAALRPGATVQAVDTAARDVLTRHGYGGAIRHATGHGLGLEVHEAPRLSKDAPADTEPLAAGVVVTIEPGAYLDDSSTGSDPTGVRIEDDLVVTDGGPEWLTHARRELIAIN